MRCQSKESLRALGTAARKVWPATVSSSHSPQLLVHFHPLHSYSRSPRCCRAVVRIGQAQPEAG